VKALVTGGAGFIGSHLAEALVKRGHRVRVLDNLATTGNLDNLQAILHRIEFIRGDIRNPKTLQKAVRGIDVVFHQAALRSVPKSVGNPLEYHEVNTTATLQLLLLARDARVRRLVFASSSSVYGDRTPLPQRETLKPTPQSPYASSKLAAEVNCVMFTRLYGLQTVSLRYFNVFGPRQSLESEYAVVVPKFIACLLQRKHPPIHGNGLQTRDFTYIDNVVEANLKAASAPKAAGEVLNIASGQRHSVLYLARSLSRLTGVGIGPQFLPPRPGDVLHTWANIGKAKKLIGYRGSVSFLEGLSRTMAWFQRHPEVWAAKNSDR